MKIRDQFANAITDAIQSYIRRFAKYDEIPADRKKDIQALWLILKETNPITLRSRLEQKLAELPGGLVLFFMFDLKKLKYPLVDLLNQDKYKNDNLRLCYEKELSLNGHSFNKEDIFHLFERINQLEANAHKSEERTQHLESEVSRLAKENSYLTIKIQELYDKNKQLDQEKKSALKRAEIAESKLQSMQDKYLKLLDENKQLKAHFTSLQKIDTKPLNSLELPRITLSSYA